MSVILPSHLGDLQAGTNPNQNKMKLVDLSAPLQKYLVMNQLLNKRHTETVTGGRSFTWEVVVNDQGSAGNVGLGYLDNPQITDTLVTASADFRNSKVDWAMIKQESAMNAGVERIVDIKLVREKTAMVSMVKLMEANWFGPSVATADDVTPWGMKTWITRQRTVAAANVAYSADGFNGGAITSGPATLGISDATYSAWRNWYFQYTNVTDEDFVRRLCKALEFTEFTPPVEGMPLLNNSLDRMMFSNYGLIGPLQEFLKSSNENLGADITRYRNAVLINGMPLIRVPYLETDTTNPIYGIDMGSVKFYRLNGFWMRPTTVKDYPGQHMIDAEFRDCTYQFVMVNRRTSFVGATSVTDPS